MFKTKVGKGAYLNLRLLKKGTFEVNVKNQDTVELWTSFALEIAVRFFTALPLTGFYFLFLLC